eukprot:5966999-Pleurochrysis_carterae.AAC.1
MQASLLNAELAHRRDLKQKLRRRKLQRPTSAFQPYSAAREGGDGLREPATAAARMARDPVLIWEKQQLTQILAAATAQFGGGSLPGSPSESGPSYRCQPFYLWQR